MKGLDILFQVKYYSGEDFEVERLDDAIKDYQVKSCVCLFTFTCPFLLLNFLNFAF